VKIAENIDGGGHTTTTTTNTTNTTTTTVSAVGEKNYKQNERPKNAKIEINSFVCSYLYDL